jgi:putative hemolysin
MNSFAPSPFRLPNGLPFTRPLSVIVEQLTGLRSIARAYEAHGLGKSPEEFVTAALRYLNVDSETCNHELALIPEHGGAVVVANHPLGGLDGLMLMDLLLRKRKDIRFFANSLLAGVPEISPLLIPVNPFGGNAATRSNGQGVRAAIRWVESGGMLVIFPAGEVAHWRPRQRAILESTWHPVVAKLIRRTSAPVYPAHISGRNSTGFQLASLIHPRLRTALLVREMLSKRGQRFRIRFGSPVAPQHIADLSDQDQLALLRTRCEQLSISDNSSTRRRTMAPISPPVEQKHLQAEVSSLPEPTHLCRQGDFDVYCAPGRLIPQLLQEIGRLREVTFRSVGEGTGRSLDLDLYDRYYLHLFIWNRSTAEVVGAYRIGQTDQIVYRYGHRRLYTHSLFQYNRRFIQKLGPALELGRSFVRLEYQRQFAPLLLLWRGVGNYVARNPKYATLFGPVSISADYCDRSRALLVDFLRTYNHAPELARHIKPRCAFHETRKTGTGLTLPKDIERLSRLLEQLERDGKGMPILLRQYLKLGGKVLGFNVDTAFANTLDALIVVDLRQTRSRTLARYMGDQEARQFLSFHKMPSTA